MDSAWAIVIVAARSVEVYLQKRKKLIKTWTDDSSSSELMWARQLGLGVLFGSKVSKYCRDITITLYFD